jgi:hypothetical protein
MGSQDVEVGQAGSSEKEGQMTADTTYFVPNEGEEAEGYHAHLGDFTVGVVGDTIFVYRGSPDATEHKVKCYGAPFYHDIEGFVAKCEGSCKLGYIRTEEAGEVLCLYDHRPEVELTEWPDGTEIEPEDRGYYDGGNFGYALNLTYDYFSEWATIHEFPRYGEDVQEMVDRQRENFAAMMEFLSDGGKHEVAIIDASPGILEVRGQ